MTNTRVAELINQSNFVSILKNELYALIDEEIAKDIEMDCDLIDELVNAIEALEQCEDENPEVILPLIFADNTILSKRIRNKVNNQKTFTRITALAASFAILLSGVNHIPATEDKSVLVYAVDAVLEGIGKVFGIEFLNNANTDEETVESTTVEPTTEITTEEPTTEESAKTEPTTEFEETTTEPEEIFESEETTTVVAENQNTNIETPTEPVIEEISKEPEVQEVVMVGIDLITDNNFKTSYLWKEELDLTGLKVVAVYSDGTEKAIPVSDCEISGFNSLKLGEQLVTVKYNGFSAFFKVTVSKTEQNNETTRTITNIEIKVKAEEIVVPKGTENPAYYEKVQYRYAYSDGTFSPWTVCKDAELVSAYDSQLIDVPQALTYRTPEGWEFTVNVIVYNYSVIVPDDNTLNINRLEITKIPDTMKYYPTNLYKCYTYVGEEIDLSQFEIKVFYKDGSFKYKTLEDSNIQVYGTTTTERPSSSKGYTITFAYGKATVDFHYDVLIEPEIQSIFIDNNRWDVYYIDNAPAEYNVEKLVTASMTDSDERVYLDVEVKGYDPNKLGFIELEVYYNGEKIFDYIGGFIYGDTGFAVVERPVTEYACFTDELNYTPYLIANRCTGNGNFETYADIKDQIKGEVVNDPNQYYQSGTAGELRAMGVTSYSVRCVDYAIVEYKISAEQKITKLGTFESGVCVYNVDVIDNGTGKLPGYRRNGISQDLTYTITVKEKPVRYIMDAPDNIKIHIQDIYSEFYDKLHVYAEYEDGRKEEIYDYSVARFSPARETTSEKLTIWVRYPTGGVFSKDVYVYSDGYEDSFYVTLRDNNYVTQNYYSIGLENPNVYLTFASAMQEDIDSFYTTTDNQGMKWDIEGWDTSTVGEKEAIITYHSPIGDYKIAYKYIVIPEYYKPSCEIVFNDENYIYDVRNGLVDGTYKVIYTDKIGRTHEMTDYLIYYEENRNIPKTVSIKNPYTNYTEKYDIKLDRIVGKFENPQVSKLEDGNYKVTIDCQYPPENGTMIYEITYRTKPGIRVMTRTIETSSLETIIDESLYFKDGVSAIKIVAYIHNDGDHVALRRKVCDTTISVPIE